MVVLCLVWSLQQISLKAIADQASPMIMVALRATLAAGLVFVLLYFRRELPAWSSGRWRPGMVAGVLYGLEYVFVAQALVFTSAAHVVMFLYTSPIFAALGLHARLKSERLNTGQWIGIVVAFGGVVLAFIGRGGKQNLKPPDIDVYEINEAFAGVVLAAIDALAIPGDIVNPNGGSIAIGHPDAATTFTRCVDTFARSPISTGPTSKRRGASGTREAIRHARISVKQPLVFQRADKRAQPSVQQVLQIVVGRHTRAAQPFKGAARHQGQPRGP